ncbi:MAG TPA: hypothetical protein VHA73_04810 [Acidimicrobiales bacterium]|jgi:hypothetical protein|nr:hypothetical protein [Acidimicrobiales bacterium]
MVKFIVAGALIVVAVVVAWVLQRRTRPGAPVQGRTWAVPGQVHRPDFSSPDVPWLVAVFTSATCDSCAAVWAQAAPLASSTVAVQEVAWQGQRALHDRYGIEAVPTVLVIDSAGVVRASFVGRPPDGELAGTVAGLDTPPS